MNNWIKYFAICLLSAAVGAGLCVGAVVLGLSTNVCIVMLFVGGIGTALTMNAFDVKDRARYDSIRYRKGIKNAA